MCRAGYYVIQTFNASSKDFAKSRNDLRIKTDVERNIEIIGEALSRIFRCDETIVISNSRKILDTRNRIIHGYDSVSDDVIGGIIIRHLPILQTEIHNFKVNKKAQSPVRQTVKKLRLLIL